MDKLFRPFIQNATQSGMIAGSQKVADAIRIAPTKAYKAYKHNPTLRQTFLKFLVPSYVIKASIGANFELHNPRVDEAINAATFQFCKETNDTATMKLNQALVELRESLKEGIGQGEAISMLARRVKEIFDDPFRALRIADTETTRALAGGELISAKESGIIIAKRWMATYGPNVCKDCENLDLEERGLDEPFYVDPRGGPYAIVQHPPKHPFCRCQVTMIPGPRQSHKPERFHEDVSIGGIRYNRPDAAHHINRMIAVRTEELPETKVLKAEVSAALNAIDNGILDPKKVAEAVKRGREHNGQFDGSKDMVVARGVLESQLGVERYWENSRTQPFRHPGSNPSVANVLARRNPMTGKAEVLLLQRLDGYWDLPRELVKTQSPKGQHWQPGLENSRGASERLLARANEDVIGTRVGRFKEDNPFDNDEAWDQLTIWKYVLPAGTIIGPGNVSQWATKEQLNTLPLVEGAKAIIEQALRRKKHAA
jgi:hypothetical protein